jgi:hypothetical protein
VNKINKGMSIFCEQRAQNYLDELTFNVPDVGSEILRAMRSWLSKNSQGQIPIRLFKTNKILNQDVNVNKQNYYHYRGMPLVCYF